MPNDGRVLRYDDLVSPALDLVIEESTTGLLSRLQSQNTALEKLLLALGEDEECNIASPGERLISVL